MNKVISTILALTLALMWPVHASGQQDSQDAWSFPTPITTTASLALYSDPHHCLTYMQETDGHCTLRIIFPNDMAMKCGDPQTIDDTLQIECSYDLPELTEAEWIDQLIQEQHEVWQAMVEMCLYWREKHADGLRPECKKYLLAKLATKGD